MLTRTQIQRLAQRNHIGMQVQERDYLQHLLLSLLYNRSQALIFKGGTALRLVYQSNRYSEDLDFNGPDDADTLRHLWRDVIAALRDFGIQAEMRNEWESARPVQEPSEALTGIILADMGEGTKIVLLVSS